MREYELAHRAEQVVGAAPPRDYSALNDAQVRQRYENTLADLALADKYEHNQHLVPQIERAIDELQAEMRRRGMSTLAPE